ncbi:hypothetical protein NDU88_008510 [Pleurodeles waltl]|uniref:Uncharacterized protein n=1 Tax=Pleurodeles waltl TaxID=8319 RepID=A0AAV7NW89_PLEWA|nr:hypothetical protein NDU88_008510 [Pleurodeles waltl]
MAGTVSTLADRAFLKPNVTAGEPEEDQDLQAAGYHATSSAGTQQLEPVAEELAIDALRARQQAHRRPPFLASF